jgi:acetyltransferase-like isoleucine patch superfamily enzyme
MREQDIVRLAGGERRIPPRDGSADETNARRRRRWLPESNERPNLKRVLLTVLHVSIMRTLYFSARHGGWCIVSRRTRLKLGPGSRLHISRGSFLFLGFAHQTPMPCMVQLGRNARMSIDGTVSINRGTRVFVNDGGHLEIGTRSYINDCSTVTCFEHITIGSRCSISWSTNILDTNVHELVVRGVPRPRSAAVAIGNDVWIGTGVTILPGVTIGDGAVVGAGSVVTSAVPDKTVAVGNPARVVSEEVSWRQ